MDQLANGPYDRTPLGRGSDYFYGFVAGETSQREPALWKNSNPISPHHVAQEWADKYKGKFSGGWDAYQERVFERQKEMGWIPANAVRPPRPDGIPAWDDIPENERASISRTSSPNQPPLIVLQTTIELRSEGRPGSPHHHPPCTVNANDSTHHRFRASGNDLPAS